MGRQDERVVLQESPDILRFADKNIRNEEERLYPDDAELQKLVQSWGVFIIILNFHLFYKFVIKAHTVP
jgi:hypothetical protein